MMIKKKIELAVEEAVQASGLPNNDFLLEHPTDLRFGDYALNVAMILAKKHNREPKELASEIIQHLYRQKENLEWLEKAEVAGPGFINLTLTRNFLTSNIKEATDQNNSSNFSQEENKNQKIIVEYTDPNPFKLFHIGHLMSNTIGEAVARILESTGAEIKRACYQGDVGLHVAKAIAYSLETKIDWQEKSALENAYAGGSKKYEENDDFKNKVIVVNKKIYDRSDAEINALYDRGRQLSLDYFESIYKRLGTKFDYYFFESETGQFGRETVLSRPDVFVKSDQAIVYQGEQAGLHTRVFINREGLPTYEAKELGLAKIKYDQYPYDRSIIVTGNEIVEYFKVLLSAMKKVFPALADKTKHLPHGMLRLPTGKMSSRTGEVITAESLLIAVKERLVEKISEKKIEASGEVLDQIAVGAVKYSILRQDIGKDLIFDLDKSIAFEGNSGPYLQYTYARAKAVLAKAVNNFPEETPRETGEGGKLLERWLYRFSEVVERSAKEYAPHYLCTYLHELAGTFNAFYATEKIIGSEDETWKLTLTQATATIMKNGLNLLGIEAPERM